MSTFSVVASSAAIGLSILSHRMAAGTDRRRRQLEHELYDQGTLRRPSQVQIHIREGHPFAPTVARCVVCNPPAAGVLGLLRFKINKAISRLDGAP